MVSLQRITTMHERNPKALRVFQNLHKSYRISKNVIGTKQNRIEKLYLKILQIMSEIVG